MSLIIGFVLRDGIIAASDRCVTRHDTNGHTANGFDSRKMALFGPRTAVLHCGDYFANSDKTISVQQLLEDCANEFDAIDPKSVPLAILNKWICLGYKSKNTMLILGYDNDEGFIYRLDTSNYSINCEFSGGKFGGVWDGVKDIAIPILKPSKCDLMSLTNASVLCDLAINATFYAQRNAINEVTVAFPVIYAIPKNGAPFYVQSSFQDIEKPHRLKFDRKLNYFDGLAQSLDKHDKNMERGKSNNDYH